MNRRINEKWLPVVGKERYYHVSTRGKVKRLACQKGENGLCVPLRELILRPALTNSGYLTVNLRRNKGNESVLIHRLMAIAFLPNLTGKQYVNHKDGVKTNNIIENLEWCSPKENMRHAMSLGLIPEKSEKFKRAEHKRLQKTRRRVSQYSLDGTFIKMHRSITECSKNTGIMGPNISACCRKIYHTTGGYIFRYSTERGRISKAILNSLK